MEAGRIIMDEEISQHYKPAVSCNDALNNQHCARHVQWLVQ